MRKGVGKRQNLLQPVWTDEEIVEGEVQVRDVTGRTQSLASLLQKVKGQNGMVLSTGKK